MLLWPMQTFVDPWNQKVRPGVRMEPRTANTANTILGKMGLYFKALCMNALIQVCFVQEYIEINVNKISRIPIYR